MDAHGVEILDRADDDDVVVMVAHHLELELLPALDGLLDQDLVGRRFREPVRHGADEFVASLRRAAARAAQREGRPDDDGQPDLAHDGLGLGERSRAAGTGHGRSDLEHRFLEELAVLGQPHRLLVGPDQAHVALFEHAPVGQREREVQSRLAADGRKDRVRPLLLDDAFEKLRSQRLDVGRVGQLRVRHDRGRIRVDEDDPVSLAPQGADRLSSGIVELAGLTDHDRPRSDDENGLQVRAFGHQRQRTASFGESLEFTGGEV